MTQNDLNLTREQRLEIIRTFKPNEEFDALLDEPDTEAVKNLSPVKRVEVGIYDRNRRIWREAQKWK